MLNPKLEMEQFTVPTSNEISSEPVNNPNNTNEFDEPQKRKLRSYRSDDCDVFSSIASTSSGASTPLHVSSSSIGFTSNYLKSLTLTNNMPPHIKDFVQSILSWRILPTSTPPTACMIFGAPHLARLIGKHKYYENISNVRRFINIVYVTVKIPEFLNASPMSDEKLKILLVHLETFTK